MRLSLLRRVRRDSLVRSHRLHRARLFVEELELRTVLSVSGLSAIHLAGQIVPNDPSFGQQYDMSKISAPTAWATTTGSRSIAVADIDSGIDYSHPDLYLNVWINQKEIPTTKREAVNSLLHRDVNSSITFADLNALGSNQNWGSATIADSTGPNGTPDGRMDARDVLAPEASGGWADGVDQDRFTISTVDGQTKSYSFVDDLVGWNFIAGNNNPFDGNGHGTHTAGTIGAIGNNSVGVAGVNWQTSIMPLKIIADDGSGSVYAAVDAIYYSVQNGARVSNNSWLVYGGSTGDILYNAIAYAAQHEQLFVAAAGNDGFNNDTNPNRAYPASYNLDNIISVTATDSKDRKPTWANYGKTSVDLGAPGVNVLSTVPGGYAYYSGTSMAAPHVTGTAALLLAKNASLTASDLKSAILNNTDADSALANRTVTGGRLDVAKAIAAAPSASTSTTTTSTTSKTSSLPSSSVKAVRLLEDLSTDDTQAQQEASTEGRQASAAFVLVLPTSTTPGFAGDAALVLTRSAPVSVVRVAQAAGVAGTPPVLQTTASSGLASARLPATFLSYSADRDERVEESGRVKPADTEQPDLPPPPSMDSPDEKTPQKDTPPPMSLTPEASSTFFLDEQVPEAMAIPSTPRGSPADPAQPGDSAAALALVFVLGGGWGTERNSSRQRRRVVTC